MLFLLCCAVNFSGSVPLCISLNISLIPKNHKLNVNLSRISFLWDIRVLAILRLFWLSIALLCAVLAS